MGVRERSEGEDGGEAMTVNFEIFKYFGDAILVIGALTVFLIFLRARANATRG